MTKFLTRVTFLFFMLLLLYSCKECKDCGTNADCKVPTGWQDLLNDSLQTFYRKNELVVIYKEKPTKQVRDSLKGAYVKLGIDTANVKLTACSECDNYVELWQGEDMHTVINGEGGTRRATDGVNEDENAHYSLNFISKLPPNRFKSGAAAVKGGRPKDTIRVAVLDTGYDTTLLNNNGNFLWKSGPEYPTGSTTNCYPNAQYGWNFVNHSSNIHDDNPGIHGTLLTEYILNEMSDNKRNVIQVMSLKTHDSEGTGTLFDIICALHYAERNGANIINASWGFYYFDEVPHPYLNELITQILPSEGILFVAAAGNKNHDEDSIALSYGFHESLLRNLDYHKFYPACLSNLNNNVISVSTNDTNQVSLQQNYSANIVDYGVFGDVFRNDTMYFNWPLNSSPSYLLNGSSFATAIVTGKIAANVPKSLFKPGITKQDVVNALAGMTELGNRPIVNYSKPLENRHQIRKGRYIKNGFVSRPTPSTRDTKKAAASLF